MRKRWRSKISKSRFGPGLRYARATWARASEDNISVLSAGVAFFGFLALFPALLAMVSLYGIAVSPESAKAQVNSFAEKLPPEAAGLLSSQVSGITAQAGLGWGLILSVGAAVLSASGGMGQLITAVNLAYRTKSDRGQVVSRLVSLGFTLGALVFFCTALFLIAIFPRLVQGVEFGQWQSLIIQFGQWCLGFLLIYLSLSLVYLLAPSRDRKNIHWRSSGTLCASGVWLLGTIGFSIYVNHFGNYQKVYGTLAGVAILLLWLHLTVFSVLLGAEINAYREERLRERGAA